MPSDHQMGGVRCAGAGYLRFGFRMDAVMMTSITIKSVPRELHEGLKKAARRNHRSLQGEIIACPERHVERLPRRKAELLAEAAALRERLPHFDHALVEEYERSGRA